MAKKKEGSKKKSIKKRSSSKKSIKKRSDKAIESSTRGQLDKAMMQNTISLQRVLTEVSTKLTGLTEKIEDLLEVFEDSAQAIVDKGFEDLSPKQNTEESKKILSKLDNLTEQNKLIARGLTIVSEKPQQSSMPVAPYKPKPEKKVQSSTQEVKPL